MSQENKMAVKIAEICQRLYARNMLAAMDGNVSCRLNDERILITPTACAKAFIEPEQMAVVDISGGVIKGKPSGETAMHLEVYKSSPKAQAVVHAHPPHAIAWSLAHPNDEQIPAEALPEVILAVGSVPIVPRAMPCSPQMAEHLRPYLPHHRALILARHGAITWGEDLDEAYFAMERVEHSCEILSLARRMGSITPLPAKDIEDLKKMRSQIGEKSL